MRKAAETNINSRNYWNGIYGTPEKREGYAASGTAFALPGSAQTTARFSKALEQVEPHSSVLDIGCGVGVFTQMVKSTYPMTEVWGVDISDQAVKDNQAERSDITYKQGYIGDLGFLPADYFDVVFSGETIEHLDEPADVFKDACRVLKPGGKLVITTPLEDGIRSPEHTWYFNHEDVTKLYIDNGFVYPDFIYLPDMEHLLVIFAVGRKV